MPERYGGMNKAEQGRKWEAFLVFYVTFLYATLGIAPKVSDWIDSVLGGGSSIFVTIIFTIAFVALLAYLIHRRGSVGVRGFVWFLSRFFLLAPY